MTTSDTAPVWPPPHLEISEAAAASPPDPDLALLEAWRRNDRVAADRLIKKYYASIRRRIHRKVPDSAVDDLVGEVLLALCEKRDRIRAGATFRAYAMRIAHNVVCDYHRRKKPLDIAGILRSSARELCGETGGRDTQQKERETLEALRSLPLGDQQLLELYLWEGLKGPELAHVFEIPEGTVRSRLERARKRLDLELAVLASEERRLEDTVTDLDTWAQAMREAFKSHLARLPGA